jgi:hypothetical protein
MPGRGLAVFCALVMFTALPACRSTTWKARFSPTPAETHVGPMDGSPPVARLLLSIRGAERRGGLPEGPFEMRVRLRVENQTNAPLELLLASFLLLDANLDAFEPPRLETHEGTDGTLSVAAGQPLLLDLMFPFPDGQEPDDLQLDGLNLRGAVRSDGKIYQLGVTFTRGPRIIYLDPWYGYYSSYGPWIGPGYYGGYGHRW